MPRLIGRLSEADAGELLQWLAANLSRVGRARVLRYFTIFRELVFKFGHVFKAQLTFGESVTAIQQYFRTQQELLDLLVATDESNLRPHVFTRCRMLTNEGLIDYICTARELAELAIDADDRDE